MLTLAHCCYVFIIWKKKKAKKHGNLLHITGISPFKALILQLYLLPSSELLRFRTKEQPDFQKKQLKVTVTLMH